MTVTIAATGAAAEAVDRVVPQLVERPRRQPASPAQDPTLWGPDAEDESAKRLGWTEAVAVSDAAGRRDRRAARRARATTGVDHIVLGGMGGSSLAPEVITRTYGVELTVLDATDPGQVLAALADRLEHDRRRHLVEVGLDRRDRQPEARLRGGLPRRRHRPASSASSSSPTRARRSTSRRARTATASSTPTPTSAAATRRSPPSASCRPASPVSTSASCSTRPTPSRSSSRIDDADNPGLVLGAAHRRHPAAARTSSASSPTARTSSASPTGPSS